MAFGGEAADTRWRLRGHDLRPGWFGSTRCGS